jgi:hypothetical protein
MAQLRDLVNAQMAALIDGTFGCLDAAAETINARTGGSLTKGTISKRLSGQIGWPVDEVAALEDAAGRHPVTRALSRRLNPDERTASGSILAQAGAISKETGEAVSAILAAQQSASAKDWAAAIAEIDEAIEALRSARSYAELHMGARNG